MIRGTLCIALAMAFIVTAAAPEAVWVQVIYYDYHSDGSNPNFQTGLPGGMGVQPDGMIKPYLGTDRRPLLNANHFFNDRIEDWYRPSGAPGAQFDFETGRWSTLVARPGTSGEYIGPQWSASDPMSDIVIYDSLPFTPDPSNPGQYMYDNQSFFPIDDRGFGNESKDASGKLRNYSFAMEIHNTFVYTGNQRLWFRGDDDLWVFINGKLAIDLGGVHGPLVDEIDLTDPSAAANFGLEKGMVYDFDLFYAERHPTGSSIWITTNFFNTREAGLELDVSPDTIRAGDTATLSTLVFDDFGQARPDIAEQVTWEILSGSYEPGDTLASGAGPAGQNRFTATQAYRTAQIKAAVVQRGIEYTATAPVTINPAEGTQAEIALVSPSPMSDSELIDGVDKVRSTPVERIVLSSADTERYLYAVLRDPFGNFVSLPRNAVWQSDDVTRVTVSASAGKSHEVILTRQPSGSGRVALLVTEPGCDPGHGTVDCKNSVVTAVKLAFEDDESQTPLDSIMMNTDEKRTLVLMGQWSDNPGVWAMVPGRWALEPDTLHCETPLPRGEAGSWSLDPARPGGSILTVATGSEEATVPIVISGAPPSSVSLVILTPADSLLAGYPVRIEVSLSNTDGLLADPAWCSSVTYSDTIADSSGERPYGLIDGEKTPLGESTMQCFSYGVDTTLVTLFDAPRFYHDSLHQISILLDNGLKSSTSMFRLHPGRLSRVEITDSHGGSLDTIKIEIDSAIMLYSQAFDAWGNTFGGVQCTWTVSEELPAVEWGKDIPSVYYHPYVSEPVRGTLTATAGQDTSIADTALVFIGPQGAVHVLNPGDSKLDNKSADGRRSDRGCGTGILLALVPPVGFRVSRYCRRGKNRCGRVIGGE